MGCSPPRFAAKVEQNFKSGDFFTISVGKHPCRPIEKSLLNLDCQLVTIVYLYVYLTPQYQNMEKIIDEAKQGENLILEQRPVNTKKLFIESYGCAMNFSDSEIVASILQDEGFGATRNFE